MPLMPDQIDDLVETVLDTFIEQAAERWVDITQTLQRFVFVERLMKDNGKYKWPLDGGPQFRFEVQVAGIKTARHSELYDKDVYAVADIMKSVKRPWTKLTCNFEYDVDEEVFSETRNRIVNYLGAREHAMYNDLFGLCEQDMWTKPATDNETPRPPDGIPAWVVKSATAAFGFNGANPAGYSSGIGLDSNTFVNWRNGTFTFVLVDDNDCLKKLAEAYTKTEFRSPDPNWDKQLDRGAYRWEMYTTYAWIDEYQRLAKRSNDNIGNDMGKYRVDAKFMGVDIVWVPAFDSDATLASYDSSDPIYGIDWRVFKWAFDKRAVMRRTKPLEIAGQHTVRAVHIDNWGQFGCLNRRCNFVGYRV